MLAVDTAQRGGFGAFNGDGIPEYPLDDAIKFAPLSVDLAISKADAEYTISVLTGDTAMVF